jgi:hypothetical protein
LPNRSLIFHPLVVLFLSLLGAFAYASYITLHFPERDLFNHYLYVVPIVIPFVAFLFDRAESFRQDNIMRLTIDALVTGTAMWRALGHVPLVSGHALFLTYGVLSARTRVAQATAAVVLLQVIYLKYFVWHDWITSTSGIVLGIVGALIWRRCGFDTTVEQAGSRPTL